MTEFFSAYMPYEAAWLLSTVIGILLIALPLMLAVAMIIYADRKIWAAIALRKGPNVVGPFGLLQSFADGLKVFLQETIVPSAANKGLFLIAPIITFTVALLAWAVVPFDVGVVLSDINVGLLYILAISSLGVYGVVIAGWASNSKYPFFSAMRASAQMISYEVSIGFVIITVLLCAGTLNLSGIVASQQSGLADMLGVPWMTFLNWYWIPLFPMFVIFFISALAETNRPPFDLVEAESELVAGHMIEYSGMSFAMFFLAEYANMILVSTLCVVLFLGGWLPPVEWLGFIPGWIWLAIKVFVVVTMFLWVRATFPRYRYDQIMRLGWKVFIPVTIVWLVVVGLWIQSPWNIWH